MRFNALRPSGIRASVVVAVLEDDADAVYLDGKVVAMGSMAGSGALAMGIIAGSGAFGGGGAMAIPVLSG